jgi:hypothetical protein
MRQNSSAIVVSDKLFQNYQQEFGLLPATLRVEADFVGANLRSDISVASIPIPKPGRDQVFLQSNVGYTFAFVELTSIHMVDEIFFDWPGDGFDEMMDGRADYSNGRFSYLSRGPEVVGKLNVTAYIDGVKVQSESKDVAPRQP